LTSLLGKMFNLGVARSSKSRSPRNCWEFQAGLPKVDKFGILLIFPGPKLVKGRSSSLLSTLLNSLNL